MYIILAVDDGNSVDESNESNNSGQGFAVDYIPVSVSGTPPTPGPPTIGSFITGASTLVRGQHLSLVANNVTDDGVVNQVVFYLDSNGNGNLDSSDQYVADGSKNGTSFTSQVSTGSWPVGDVTLFARAIDNDGNYSLVKSVDVTVQGNGPATDDAYEHNDTPATATYLGGAGTYQLNNLSITQNDQDFFSFDVPNGNANIQAQINFFQETPQNGPVGDLALELINPYGNSVGFSNTSQAGNTSEQISFTGGAGRYTLHVFGSTVFGVGGTDTNANYQLHVSVTPPAGYPLSETLTANPNPVHQGDDLTLLLGGSTVPTGSSIYGVYFFRDVNGNGQIDDGEVLGSDEGNPDGPNGQYMWSGLTSNWPAGTSRVYAYVLDTLGRASLATSIEVQVSANLPPAIGSISVASAVTQGDTLTIMAQNVSDDESVSQVNFFRDVNGNGILDAGDVSVGTGVQSGNTWTLAISTAELPLGTAVFFAQAVDNRGKQSAPVAVGVMINASTNQPPVIGSLSGPSSLEQGSPLTLQASSITDPNGDAIRVFFYLDSNGNGVFDDTDQLLGEGTQNGSDWSLTVPTNGWSQGNTLLFARAVDNGVPNLSTVASLSVTVIDTTGPRVITQSPTTTVLGSLDSVLVTFDEPIDPASFTVADVTSFVGPAGAISPTSVDPVSGTGNTQFVIRFPRQTAVGSYSLVIGPDILDLAGNPMNQDGDTTNGEPVEDSYPLAFTLQSPLADFNWAEAFGGAAGSEIAFGLTTDAAGNLYVTGQFYGTVDFDPGPGIASRTSAGGNDIFVAKYTSAGAFVWVTAMGGPSSEWGQGVAVDGSGNVYVTGFFANTANFGSFTLSSPGTPNGFLAKLDSNGSPQWVRQISSTSKTVGNAVAVDNSGVYVTGQFQGTADFGGTTRTSAGDIDIFTAKWNSTGNLQWVNSYGGSGRDLGYGLALDAAGNVYTVGQVTGSVTFGNDTVSSGSGFALKLTGAGSPVWARATGAIGLAAAATPAGDLYLVGNFDTPTVFDPGPATTQLTPFGSADIFVSKLGSDGTFRWARQMGGGQYDQAYGVAADAAGNVYTTGLFEGTADLDPGDGVYNLTSRGGDDAFISRLDMPVTTCGAFPGWQRL